MLGVAARLAAHGNDHVEGTPARRKELVLADAGLYAREIGACTGRNPDAVRSSCGRQEDKTKGQEVSDDRTTELLDEVVKLIALNLRERAEDPNDLILSLDKMGFEGPRIAELMGTTPANVRQVRYRAKRPGKKG